MTNHRFFIRRCIELAKKGKGYVSPNPMVGCVITKNGKIIGEGYHKKYGDHHAEVNAINNVNNKNLLKDATLYVNLEPCSHTGKTPPCSDLIIKYKISKVIIGCIDTFKEVNGKGVKRMRDAGIEVITGILEEESKLLNKRFFVFHRKKRPYIILKWAESCDGFIAPKKQSKPLWLTSNKSKILVHKWRAEEDAILVGRITAEKDNPKLTVREVKGNNPVRIIIDNKLKLSNNLNIFNDDAETIIINLVVNKEREKNTFIKINKENFIKTLLYVLYKKKIQSILIEGGSKTIQSFIDSNFWDEARVFKTNHSLNLGIKSPYIKGKITLNKKVMNDELLIMSNI